MPVYIISGRLVFGFFSDSTTGSLMSICVSAPLIKKVYFPKYILVLSKITSSFIILLISLIDLALVMLVTGAPITIYALYAPLYLLLLYIFVVGCGLILSTLNVFFRDMEHLYGIVVLVLMYFSAIFYPVEIIPAQVQKLLIFNPVYHYITGFRYAVYYGLSPDWSNIIYCVGASLAFLIVGILVFKKNQDKFILYI